MIKDIEEKLGKPFSEVELSDLILLANDPESVKYFDFETVEEMYKLDNEKIKNFVSTTFYGMSVTKYQKEIDAHLRKVFEKSEEKEGFEKFIIEMKNSDNIIAKLLAYEIIYSHSDLAEEIGLNFGKSDTDKDEIKGLLKTVIENLSKVEIFESFLVLPDISEIIDVLTENFFEETTEDLLDKETREMYDKLLDKMNVFTSEILEKLGSGENAENDQEKGGDENGTT